MPEKRKGFTTLALKKETLQELRRKKRHPMQSDNDVLEDVLNNRSFPKDKIFRNS